MTFRSMGLCCLLAERMSRSFELQAASGVKLNGSVAGSGPAAPVG
jgi:hypothetical protein